MSGVVDAKQTWPETEMDFETMAAATAINAS
jgi:hypothetical protein